MISQKKILILFLILSSCTGKVLHYEKTEQLKKNDEFDQKVKIIQPATPGLESKPEAAAAAPALPIKKGNQTPPVGKKITQKKNKKSKAEELTAKSKVEGVDSQGRREPEIEDTEGFVGRRPVVDPFRVGEEVVHKVYYDASLFDLSAGTLSMRVNPFVEVNGRKSYQFEMAIKSSDWFSNYYSVDDQVIALMDFDLLIPRVFQLHVKESGQLRETKSFFDFDQMKAFFWEKKVTKKNGEEERKLEWEILPYSQNVFSALYYLRLFKWEIGKEYSFHVSDDKENLIFKGKALKKEVLKAEIGSLPAIKIKPEFMLKGAFKPVGDIYIWVSDDEFKQILRIESKIKIGTLISEVQSIQKGK